MRLPNVIGRLLSSGTETKSVTLTDPYAAEIFGIIPTASGANITPATAMRVPAVLQAVRLISETVGSLPCKTYRRTAEGKEAASDHASYRITHRRANEWTSAAEFRTALTIDALLHGHGFAKVARYPDGRPFELHRVDPSLVTIKQASTGEPVYVVREGNRDVPYSFTDLLHLQAFAGASPVSLGKEAIGLSTIIEKQLGQYFNSGAKPSLIFTVDDRDEVKAVAKIKNLKAQYRALTQNGGFSEPMFIEGGTVTSLTYSAADSQTIENRQFQIDEIARIFGVPPHMLFQLDRATWSNAEQMGATFLQLCLQPWLTRWQNAYDTVLFTDDERDDFYSEFVVDDLQRADAAGRAEIFGKLIAMRAMTPNEVRSAMNLPPLSGGDELANPYTTTTTTGPATIPAKKEAA